MTPSPSQIAAVDAMLDRDLLERLEGDDSSESTGSWAWANPMVEDMWRWHSRETIAGETVKTR